jgi:hypothetical protein
MVASWCVRSCRYGIRIDVAASRRSAGKLPPIGGLPSCRGARTLAVVVMSIRHIRAANAAIEPELNGVGLLREQLRVSHTALDASAASWLRTPLSAPPWPRPVRLYLHALCVEDFTIQSVLREDVPRCLSLWQNLDSPADVGALRQYARAVYAATDAYLAELPADGLRRMVDLSKLGLGRHTVLWVARRFVIQELGAICRDISSGTAS